MNKKNNIISTMVSIFIMILLLVSIFANFFFIENKDVLESQIKQRDTLIDELNKQNSSIQGMLDKKYSLDSLSSRSNVVSVDEIVKYSNSLVDEISELYQKINNLNDSLSYYKSYFHVSQKAFNHNYTATPNASGGRNYTFEPNAVPKEQLKKCQEALSKETTEKYKLSSEVHQYKNILQKYKIDKNGYSAKLDSALMLLWVYGDRLKYNKEKNEWKVGKDATITTTTLNVKTTYSIDAPVESTSE